MSYLAALLARAPPPTAVTPDMCAVDPNLDGCFDVCFNDPSLALCANVGGYYMYRPSLAANATFAGLFGLSLLVYIAIYAVTRRGLGFTIAFLCGLVLEVLGYAGRIMSWKNMWDQNGFLMQICCLTIAPAFFAAGIYLCLRRIVYAFGPENSRIAPEWYTRLFIPCDVVSLVLQATGGAMASIASNQNESVQTGDNIMIAGLAFQVATLLLFMACALDFAINATLRRRRLGADAFDQDAAAVAVRGSWQFRGFLAALTLATICIFWRSVYRVAELSQGWTGPLMSREDLFIGFEGVMIVVAVYALSFFHPNVSFRELMEGAGGLGSSKKQRKGRKAGGKSEPVSDVDGMATP